MEHTFDELKKKTVAGLREIAKGIEHDALHGHSTMHKEPLVLALCTALGIEAHDHHKVLGVDKAKLKKEIRELKSKRDTALGAHDHKELKSIRRQLHHLRRRIRKATV